MNEKLRASDQVVAGSSPAPAAAQVAADSQNWGEAARRINLGLGIEADGARCANRDACARPRRRAEARLNGNALTELDANAVDLEIVEVGRAIARARLDSQFAIQAANPGHVEHEGHLSATGPVALGG